MRYTLISVCVSTGADFNRESPTRGRDIVQRTAVLNSFMSKVQIALPFRSWRECLQWRCLFVVERIVARLTGKKESIHFWVTHELLLFPSPHLALHLKLDILCESMGNSLCEYGSHVPGVYFDILCCHVQLVYFLCLCSHRQVSDEVQRTFLSQNYSSISRPWNTGWHETQVFLLD